MKKRNKILITLLGSIVALVVAVVFLNTPSAHMTDDVRRSLNKEFVPLKNGSISYQWAGPQDGEVVVLVHGFSTPSVVFMNNVNALVQSGFRVLTFDHFGRGYSDRPNIDYGKQLYDDELIGLFDALNINTPVNLVGYSMGGGIATVFAANHPERVKRLVLIAPVGFLPEPSTGYKVLLIPVIGEWVMKVFGKKSMISRLYADVKTGDVPAQMAEEFENQFSYKGVEHALVSTVAHYPMQNLKKDYEQLGKQSLPKLLIWGTADSSVPFAGSEKVLDLLPGAAFLKLDNLEHSIPYSDAAVVNESMIAFFMK